MKLSDYFEKVKGYGVLSTANSTGKINSAIYARPHFADENTVVFIMAERLTHANLQENPYAAYLFIEEGGGYSGKRLYLTRMRAEVNEELADTISRAYDYALHKGPVPRHVVYFAIDKVLPLIGPGP